VKLNKEQEQRAEALIKTLLHNSKSRSYVPMLPLRSEDCELIGIFLESKGRTIDQLGKEMVKISRYR
jgi:hypothetical protein